MRNIEKIKRELSLYKTKDLKILVKDIYDERKHNPKLTEGNLKDLKDLEEKIEKELRNRTVLNKDNEKDFENWKKNLKNGKKCF